jgi:hypothetical protein
VPSHQKFLYTFHIVWFLDMAMIPLFNSPWISLFLLPKELLDFMQSPPAKPGCLGFPMVVIMSAGMMVQIWGRACEVSGISTPHDHMRSWGRSIHGRVTVARGMGVL